jgi:small subunit ribosomal protein S6
MRAYETTFVLVPSLDGPQIQEEVSRVKEFIASQGGEITAEKEWGRRRLAYPIQDHSEGIYHILRFDLEPGALPELDRWYKLNENVLRALVIRDEGTPLDYIGQVSESEERTTRDSRDRRPGDRAAGDRPRPAPSESAPPTPTGETEPTAGESAAGDEEPVEAAAAIEAPTPGVGEEESRE